MNENIKFFINDTKKIAPTVFYRSYKSLLYDQLGPRGGYIVIDINSYIEYPYYKKKSFAERQHETIHDDLLCPNEYMKETHGYDTVTFTVVN